MSVPIYLSLMSLYVDLIGLFHLLVSFSVSSVTLICLFYCICLLSLSVPFYCPPCVCLIFLLHLSVHLPVSYSISSVWCYLLVLCTAHLYVLLAVCSVSFVWLICCLSQLSVSPFTICLSLYLFVYLSYVYFFASCFF